MKLMLMILTLFMFVFLAVGCCQPNTTTTMQVGIVNMQPDKDYLVFAEIVEDTLPGSRLVDSMDYMNPNVSDLDITSQLTNPYIDADTTFWDYEYPDITVPQFAKGGLVQVNKETVKYSAMRVSGWVETDSVEPNAAGFIFRRKQ